MHVNFFCNFHVMKHLLLLLLPLTLLLQRGKTGDATFADRFPPDVVREHSNAYLTITNFTDHDVIALVRGQRDEYLRHVYIRTGEMHVFEKMPITRFYVQFKSRDFYFEDLERTVMNYGERHTFEFFYDPKQAVSYKQITEEDFFRH